MILGGLVRDVLLPRTDGGVAAQAVVAVVLGLVALWLARKVRQALLVVVGLILLTAAFFGLRMVH